MLRFGFVVKRVIIIHDNPLLFTASGNIKLAYNLFYIGEHLTPAGDKE